jgi:hypothetical protein
VCPARYRHPQANRADERSPNSTFARPFVDYFQNQPHFLKVSTMRQTDVAAPAFSPAPVPTFTAAAVRFVASLATLIGVSLLLSGL